MAHTLPATADGLALSRDAHAIGLYSTLLTARRHQQLVPIRRGVYLSGTEATAMTPVDRYRATVLAVGLQRRAPVFAGVSAAVLWGLPLVGALPAEVFLLGRGRSGRRRNGVVEFATRDALSVAAHDGLLLTSLPDTLVDVARTQPLVTALAMADAALHVPRFGGAAPLCTMRELSEAYERRLPFPGSSRVLAVLARATTLADSPLETVSRLQIEALGFPEPVLQHPVTLRRDGRTVFLDTAWPEFGVWGEADGAGKYQGSALLAGDTRSPAAIVREEKRREDAVRAATRWTPARWDWTEAWGGTGLRAILLQAGLPITRRPRQLL